MIVHPEADENFTWKRRANVLTILPNVMPDEFEDWEPIIDKMIERGYNWFHICPFQKPGKSNSVYSISDYLAIDRKFRRVLNSKEAFDKLCEIMDRKRPQCKFFVDIVINHCSVDSKWVIESPKSTYNLQNTPQLNLAYLVDKSLTDSMQVFTKELDFIEDIFYKIGSFWEIDQIIDCLRKKILGPLKMDEFLKFDMKKIKSDFEKYAKQIKPKKSTTSKNSDDFNSEDVI